MIVLPEELGHKSCSWFCYWLIKFSSHSWSGLTSSPIMLAKLMPLLPDSLAARVQVCEIGSVTQTHTLNLDAKVRNVGSSCTGCLDLVVSPAALASCSAGIGFWTRGIQTCTWSVLTIDGQQVAVTAVRVLWHVKLSPGPPGDSKSSLIRL